MLKTKTALKVLFTFFTITIVFAAKSFAGSDSKSIDTAQLHAMIVDNAYRLEAGRDKQFAIFDARTKEEYNEAHIFSAISIPDEDFDEFITLLPKDKTVQLVVYCNDIKCGTSAKWASKAAARGYANIIIYSEGFSAWKTQHMPTAPLQGGR
jgi:rhodanese-related sulfurtransferase